MNKSRLIRLLAFVLPVLLPLVSISGDSVKFTSFSGHKSGAVQGSDKLDPEMFRARPMQSLYYMELWFHDAIFEDEGIIFNLNFQMNNLGIQNGHCDVFAMVSDPKTNVIIDHLSFSPEDVKVDEKGFGITAGPNRIEIDGENYKIKVNTAKINAVFTYKPLAGSFRLGDGYTRFSGGDDFFQQSMPIPWAEVTGTLVYNGKSQSLKGHGSLNHEYQNLEPSNFMSRVRVMYLYDDDWAIRLNLDSSKNLGGDWIQALLVANRERVVFSSHDYRFEELEVKPVPGAKVPCPRLFKVSAVHGADSLEGEIKVTAIQEKKNILGDYNVVFQQIAHLLIAETWSYRFWTTYDFTLTLDGEKHKISGKGAGNYLDSVTAEK